MTESFFIYSPEDCGYSDPLPMFPRILIPGAAALVLSVSGACAQALNTEYSITKVTPATQASPSFSISGYDKRVSKGKDWLEVEVAFDWQSRAKEPKFTEELTFNYYILLNNAQFTADKKQTLLTGSVTHSSIPQGRDLHSVVYVSPRTLERFFEGRPPANAQQTIYDVGVTISKQGQLVAEYTLKGKGAWWTQFQQTPGYVLNKNETPFGPLAWDYYEAIKARGPGL